MNTSIGGLLRHWRTRRRMSQLALAEEAEVSTRHLSCLETGKARPSREMVLVLASAMEVPLRERNTLLQAAGFAPAYRESALESPALAQVDRVIDHLMRGHEPYGAVVVDRLWNVVRCNRPFQYLLEVALGGPIPERFNLIAATFDPNGLRPYVVNYEEVARATLDRATREAAVNGDLEMEAMVHKLAKMPGVPEGAWVPDWDSPAPLCIPVELELMGQRLRFFTTITTLGTAVDVTLSELRIESYFPLDEATDAAVHAIAQQLGPA